MSDTSTVSASDSPSSFSALPAESWKEPAASESSGTATQTVETPAADATSAITPAGRDSAESSATPREGADGAASSSGPIPFDRHKEILEAERKQRTDLDAKWQRVAWAEELVNAGRTREQIQQALDVFDGIDTHPDQFLERFYEILSQDPRLTPAMTAFRERLIKAAHEDREPQPEYFEGTDPQTGQRGRFLTEQSLREREAWIKRQYEKQVAPLKRDQEERAHKEQTLEVANRIYKSEFDSMKAAYEDVSKLPFFADIKADIKAHVEGSSYKMSLHEAYTKALNEKILPTLRQTEKANVLAELRTQANASGLKPSAPVAATPGPAPRNFKDLPAEAWK